MMILGSDRYITQDYEHHLTAEDYSGEHLSPVKIVGSAKVIRVVNHYLPHEDSLNYQEFLRRQYEWKDGDYYNCISLTGKQVRYPKDELGGNCIELEGTIDGENYRYGLFHLASVNVNVGDVVDGSTILGYQGNTGLVFSGKEESDPTYGTHVHMEVKDSSGNFTNPREFALGNRVISYATGSNERDPSVDQVKILVNDIRIRKEATTDSDILGKVYEGEFYTVYGSKEDDNYIWYQIKTASSIEGYIASSKTETWMEFLPKEQEEEPNPPKNPCDDYKLLYTCPKTDTYYLKLYEGEQVYLKESKNTGN